MKSCKQNNNKCNILRLCINSSTTSQSLRIPNSYSNNHACVLTIIKIHVEQVTSTNETTTPTPSIQSKLMVCIQNLALPHLPARIGGEQKHFTGQLPLPHTTLFPRSDIIQKQIFKGVGRVIAKNHASCVNGRQHSRTRFRCSPIYLHKILRKKCITITMLYH